VLFVYVGQNASKGFTGFIPYLEAWYPKPIPFHAIEKFIVSDPPKFIDFNINELDEFENFIRVISQVWEQNWKP
jgi:hypothetical protein